MLFSSTRIALELSKVSHNHGVSFHSQKLSSHAHLLFAGLDDVLSRLEQVEQRPSLLFINWVTPATQMSMKVTWVSPGEEDGPKGLTK